MHIYMIVVTVLAIIIATLQLLYSWSSSNLLLFWLTLPALLYALCTAWQLLSRKGHRFVRCFPLAMLPLWILPFIAIAGIIIFASHGMEGSVETTSKDMWFSSSIAVVILLPIWLLFHWAFVFQPVQKFSTASLPISWTRTLPIAVVLMVLFSTLIYFAPIGKSQIRLAHLAAANGWTSTMKLLLTCGTPVNVRDRDGNTPLHLAAFAHQQTMTTLLLKHGANIEAVNNTGQTPLLCALGYLTIDNYYNFYNYSWGREDLLSEERYAMLLISAGANIKVADKKGATPLTLSFAMIDDNPEFIQTLIERGADINRVGTVYQSTLLDEYLYRDHLDTVKKLMARGARLRSQSMVYCVSQEAVLFLLKNGIDINAKGPDGATILLSKVRDYRNDVSFIRFLLSHGARVTDDRDQQGRTMIEYAKETGNTTLLQTLEDARKRQ